MQLEGGVVGQVEGNDVDRGREADHQQHARQQFTPMCLQQLAAAVLFRGLLRLQHQRLFQTAPDDLADRNDQDANQEGDAPPPGLECGRRQRMTEHQCNQGSENSGNALAGRLPAGVEAPRSLIRILEQHRAGRAHLAADGEALDQAGKNHQHGGKDAKLRIGWRHHQNQRTEGHQPHREHHRRLAAYAVGIRTDNQAAQRPHQIARPKCAEGQQQLAERIADWKIQGNDQEGEEVVDT